MATTKSVMERIAEENGWEELEVIYMEPWQVHECILRGALSVDELKEWLKAHEQWAYEDGQESVVKKVFEIA